MYLSPAQSQALPNSPLETRLRPHRVHDTFLDPMLCPHHFLPHPGPLKSLSTLWWALQLVSLWGPRTDAERGSENVTMTNNQINELVKDKPDLGHIHQRSSFVPPSRARVSGGHLPEAQGSSLTLTSSKTLTAWVDFIFSFISFYTWSHFVTIPLWTEESGELQFMGSQRVGNDWATEHTYDP